jgi:hypothetical protein
VNIVKDNAEQLITAGVITEEVRFIAQTRKNKTKKSIEKFERTKATLNSAH